MGQRAGMSPDGIGTASKERLRIDEADWVVERVAAVEAALAPGSNLDSREGLAARSARARMRRSGLRR